MNEKKKLGLIGCGFLGGIIAKAYHDGLLPDYELVGVLGRSPERAQKTAQAAGAKMCGSLDELLSLKPDFVAEAASGQVVRDMALPILESGAHFVVLSIGAFADQAFLEQVKKTAAEHHTQVHLASGAIGGFDVLQTVSLMARAAGMDEKAGIHTHKSPASLRGSVLFKEELLDIKEEQDAFKGCAKEAIALMPTKVNVAVACALATTGPEHSGVTVTAVPGFVGDDHHITAEIQGVKADVDIYSNTSAIAGWSVVALLRNLASPISFQ